MGRCHRVEHRDTTHRNGNVSRSYDVLAGTARPCCLSAALEPPPPPGARWQELPKELHQSQEIRDDNHKPQEGRRHTLPTLVPGDEDPEVDPLEIIDMSLPFGSHTTAMLDRQGFSLQDVLDGNVPALDPEAMLEAARHENDEPGTED